MNGVWVREENKHLIISNGIIEISFNLQTGKYCAKECAGAQNVIEGAHASVNGYKSCGSNVLYKWREEDVKDVLGRGKMICISCVNLDGVEVILGIILYEQKKFAAFRCGIKNGSTNSIRIKTIKPLDGGIAFQNVRNFKDIKLLDGNSGAFPTKVLHGGSMESKNNAMLTFGTSYDTNTLVLGGLKYRDFVKYAKIEISKEENSEFARISLFADDPYGRFADIGDIYFPEEDMYYLDFCTKNPFTAMETYGKMLRAAQKAEPNSYQFPSVCLWYAEFYDMLSNGTEKINTSSGAVAEMRRIKNSGFLKYAQAAVRLVPDYYGENHKGGNIQQGWWDDEHWQKYQSADEGNGRYTEPYETTEKWANAVLDLGGIPLTYFQTSAVSEDYAVQFPGHMLFNNGKCRTGEWLNGSYNMDTGYDFTDGEFQNHMKAVYKNLKDGGVKGMMFDYPGTAWNTEGGFENPYATAANNYVNVFRLAKEGLGKDSYIHERGCETGYDVALGWVDSQRTEDDTADMPPQMVEKIGLRWYKNRVVTNYDMDSKDLRRAQSFDELHTLVTMAYAVSGRLLIANSFKNLDENTLFSLSRIYPQHTEPKSFRPIDAFIRNGYPRIYDYDVNSEWHQVIFYNGDRVHPADIEAPLSGDTAFGCLGLEESESYYVYDFWNDNYVGKLKGTDTLRLRIRKGESRMLSVRKVCCHPMVVSANRHIMQGAVELEKEYWDGKGLSGTANITSDEEYCIKIKIPDELCMDAIPEIEEDGVEYRLEFNPFDNIVTLCLLSKENKKVKWRVLFSEIKKRKENSKIPEKPLQFEAEWKSSEFSVELSWKCAEEYEFYVYGNTGSECCAEPLYLIGKTRGHSFVDRDIQNHSVRYYQIAAKSKEGLLSEPVYFKYEADFEVPVKFTELDYITKDRWKGVYGGQGYSMRGNENNDRLPCYVSSIICNGKPGTYKKEKSQYCPDIPGSSEKHRGYEGNTGILSYTVNVSDDKEHQAAFYCADINSTKFSSEKDKRKMLLELRTLSGKVMNDDILIENFKEGVYIKLRYKGSFTLTLRNMVYIGLMDSVCSAIFFD